MRMRALHLAVGLAGAVAFVGTGIYMRAGFPDLYAANEAVRYTYRANHVYVLLASLVNVTLGIYFVATRTGWHATAAAFGSILALASPVVLCFAFFLEAPAAHPERILTLVGVVALATGVAAHVVSATARE